MSGSSPKIDPRSYEDIVGQTERLAQTFTEWRPLPKGQPDAGRALMRLFGRMATVVSDRLNQAPDKNMLAFLDLIGTQIQPPRPARVPLTFTLAAGSQGAFIPALTQVAAPPQDPESEEVIFETERDLVLTAAQLKAVMVRDPRQDRYCDRTPQATATDNTLFRAFEGEQLIEHKFYLAHDQLFALPAPKTLTLTLQGTNARGFGTLPMSWSYWDGTAWQTFLGIVDGLAVVIESLLNQVRVLAGQAVDGEGQQIHLPQTQVVNLSGFSNQTVLIVASYQPSGPVVEAIADADAGDYPAHTYLRLARVDVKADDTIEFSRPTATATATATAPEPWSITFNTLPIAHPVNVNGLNAVWLQVQLNNTPVPAGEPLPAIDILTARAEITGSDIAPDCCVFNSTTLDISKDFYPFGEQPRFNDTFYLASDQVFAKAGGTVTVTVTLTEDHLPYTGGGAELAWEAWTGEAWERLTVTSSQGTEHPTPVNLTTSGSLSLILPPQTATTSVSGETHYWLRVRLLKGDYGQAAFTRPRPAPTGSNESYPTYEFVEATLQPPSVASLQLAYTYTSGESFLSNYQTYNDFAHATPWSTLTDAAYSGQNNLKVASVANWQVGDRVHMAPGQPTAELNHQITAIDTELAMVTLQSPLGQVHAAGTAVVRSFQPFTAPAEHDPALYLGFDRPFANQPMTLYAQAEPPLPGEIVNRNTVEQPAQVVWEYASPTGWATLGAEDETLAFSERGVIRFIGPDDWTAGAEFGQTCYWLRARWSQGDFALPPRLRRLLTNTTWSRQAITRDYEIIGSSNGNLDQRFRTSQVPVLTGQHLEVQEPDPPSTAEQLVIEREEGGDAIAIQTDDTDQITEVWVRWHEVPDFYGSGPRDRHYLLDHLTGEVIFGNNQQGRVPPQGRNNIRMARYQTGGGRPGNLPPASITELKTTLPYVDSVTHWEIARGGADLESFDRLRNRGPKALRHRDRAVTAQDFEDLAITASTQVGRALAITPHFSRTGLQWLPMYHLHLEAPGEIRITVTLSAGSAPDHALAIKINGPQQAIPYLEQTIIPPDETASTDIPQVVYTVSETQFLTGTDWSITLTNLGPSTVTGKIVIRYPSSSQETWFEAPIHPTTSETEASSNTLADSTQTNPYRDIEDAGRVELSIVPNLPVRQPTPSLELIHRVESYLRERCAPAIDLWVTEPAWVQVTVTAAIVPASLDVADTACADVEQALTQFLHPTSGGTTGQGWAFGRRPHQSDLYAVIEGVSSVDYVQSLSVSTDPGLDDPDEDDPRMITLAEDLRERFLIYSGHHQIRLVQGTDQSSS